MPSVKSTTETSQKVRDLLGKIEKACHRKTASIKKTEEGKKYSEKSEAVREAILKIGRSQKDLISLMEEVIKEPIRPFNSGKETDEFLKFSVIVPLKKGLNGFDATVGNPIIYLSNSKYGYDYRKNEEATMGNRVNKNNWRPATKEEITEAFLAIAKSKKKADELVKLVPKEILIEFLTK